MSEGWIKLHRQLLECDLWVGFDSEEPEPFDKRSAWIDLLLRANHRDKEIYFGGKPLAVERGQLITSVRKLSSRWGWSAKKTYNYLEMLTQLGMIEKASDSRKTLLTIVNYTVFQDSGNTEETVKKQSGNTKETLSAHKQECKEVKNEKNSNKYNVCFEEFWKVYPRRIDKGKASKCYQARVNDGWREEELLTAAKNYAEYCEQNHTDTKYIKHPSTFLSASTPFTDYLQKGVTDGATGVGRYSESDEEYAERMAELERRIAAGEFDQDEDEQLF